MTDGSNGFTGAWIFTTEAGTYFQLEQAPCTVDVHWAFKLLGSSSTESPTSISARGLGNICTVFESEDHWQVDKELLRKRSNAGRAIEGILTSYSTALIGGRVKHKQQRGCITRKPQRQHRRNRRLLIGADDGQHITIWERDAVFSCGATSQCDAQIVGPCLIDPCESQNRTQARRHR